MHEQELQDALDAVGVAQISCNPITDNNAAKALQRVAAEEAMPLSKEQALSIARSAAGDLRSAIEAVQLLCTGVAPLPPQPKTRKVAQLLPFSAPGNQFPNSRAPAWNLQGASNCYVLASMCRRP
jgi:DNA polymerase III delta prime subunit